MLITIIVPNLNNEGRLQECLAAVREQTLSQGNFELIVVDNGSKDDSLKIAHKFADIVMQADDFESPYLCRNIGLKEAKGDLIVLLDSNCVPSKDWLEAGTQLLLAGEADLVVGPLLFEFQTRSVFEKFDFLYALIRKEDIENRIALPTTHLFFNRRVYEKIGPFINNIRSHGDMEWTNRALNAGFRFGFAEKAAVFYPAKPFRKFIKKYIRLGRGIKEVWICKGNRLFEPIWIWKITKNFLPPSPTFIHKFRSLDRKEQTGLSVLSLFFLGWFVKVLYALGMIGGKYNKETIPTV